MPCRMSSYLLVAAVTLCASAVADPATTPASAANAAPAADNADPMVCRMLDPPVGSRLGARKICHKQSEWLQIETDAHDIVNQIQKAGTLSNPKGG